MRAKLSVSPESRAIAHSKLPSRNINLPGHLQKHHINLPGHHQNLPESTRPTFRNLPGLRVHTRQLGAPLQLPLNITQSPDISSPMPIYSFYIFDRHCKLGAPLSKPI